MKRDDMLWKSVLEDVFDDFLRFFFSNADQLFNIGKEFEFLDKELGDLIPAEDMKSSKHIDKLIKIFTRRRKEPRILIHVEIQGYRDNGFEERMFTYFYRIRDRLRLRVIPIAILTDRSRGFRPEVYIYDCFGGSVQYKFNIYKIADQQEADLLKNDNPFSVVILTVLLALKQENMKDPELLVQKIELAKHLLGRNLPPVKARSLMRFLKYYVRFENKKYNTNFDTAIREITNKKETMGIEEFMLDRAKKEGIEEGLQKGIKKGVAKGVTQGIAKGHDEKTREFAKSLILNTDFTIAKIASLVNVSPAFVRTVKKSLN
jgi:hypothetical protein